MVGHAGKFLFSWRRFLSCRCSSLRSREGSSDGETVEEFLGLPNFPPCTNGDEYHQMKDDEAANKEQATTKTPTTETSQRTSESMSSVLRQEFQYIVLFFITGYLFYGHYAGWSAIDCIYFSVVVVTSVGYGDLVPTTEIEMLFTAVYILAAMVIVISAISRIVDIFVSGKVVAAMQQAEEAKEKELQRMCKADSDGGADDLFVSDEEHARLERKKQIISCLKAFAMLCAWGGVGTFFFSSQEEFLEGNDNLKDVRPWVGALYFTVVTLTTVGFGDDCPKTDLQKTFCVLFILIGVPLFGAALTEFTALLKGEEAPEEQALNMITSLDEGKVNSLMEFERELNEACGQGESQESGEIDRFEYTAFILVKNGAIKMEALQEIMRSFNKLDVDGSGSISRDDLPSSFS